MSADVYCSALASGGGTGSFGSPLTLYELRTAGLSNNDVIGCLDDGTYTADQADASGSAWCAVGLGLTNLTILPLDAAGNFDPTARIRVDASALNSFTAAFLLQGQRHHVFGLEIDGDSTGAGSGLVVQAPGSQVAHGVFEGVGSSGVSILSADVAVLNCVCQDNGSHGINMGSVDGIKVLDSLLKDNAGDGIAAASASTQYALIARCIAQGNTGRGIEVGINCMVSRCTARDNGSDGFYEASDGNTYHAIMATGNGGWGINLDSGGNRSVVLQPFFGSGGAANTLGQSSIAGEVFGAVSGDPAYTSSTDSTPGASSDALDEAQPGAYLVNGSTDADCGAIERAANTTNDSGRAETIGVM